jgi:hypothetical protein
MTFDSMIHRCSFRVASLKRALRSSAVRTAVGWPTARPVPPLYSRFCSLFVPRSLQRRVILTRYRKRNLRNECNESAGRGPAIAGRANERTETQTERNNIRQHKSSHPRHTRGASELHGEFSGSQCHISHRETGPTRTAAHMAMRTLPGKKPCVA